MSAPQTVAATAATLASTSNTGINGLRCLRFAGYYRVQFACNPRENEHYKQCTDQ
jgi:hypothetical protein